MVESKDREQRAQPSTDEVYACWRAAKALEARLELAGLEDEALAIRRMRARLWPRQP